LKLTFSETFPADNIATACTKTRRRCFCPTFSGTVYFHNESGQQTFALSMGVVAAIGVVYKRGL
jgi:hypothetical protein